MSSTGGEPTDTVELLCCWNAAGYMGVLVRVYLYVV